MSSLTIAGAAVGLAAGLAQHSPDGVGRGWSARSFWASSARLSSGSRWGDDRPRTCDRLPRQGQVSRLVLGCTHCGGTRRWMPRSLSRPRIGPRAFAHWRRSCFRNASGKNQPEGLAQFSARKTWTFSPIPDIGDNWEQCPATTYSRDCRGLRRLRCYCRGLLTRSFRGKTAESCSNRSQTPR